MTRIMRANFLDHIRSEYVTTARSKGVSESRRGRLGDHHARGRIRDAGRRDFHRPARWRHPLPGLHQAEVKVWLR